MEESTLQQQQEAEGLLTPQNPQGSTTAPSSSDYVNKGRDFQNPASPSGLESQSLQVVTTGDPNTSVTTTGSQQSSVSPLPYICGFVLIVLMIAGAIGWVYKRSRTMLHGAKVYDAPKADDSALPPLKADYKKTGVTKAPKAKVAANASKSATAAAVSSKPKKTTAKSKKAARRKKKR